MSIQDAAFLSNFEIDKVIGSFSGSFSIPAATSGGGFVSSSVSFPTNIPESTFFRGIYSVDGGATWNDFGSYIVQRPATTNPAFTTSVFGRSLANTFHVSYENSYDFVAGTGYAYTCMYKVILIAKPNQGIIEPQPIGDIAYFKSGSNYQKILSDQMQSFSISPGGQQTFTFPHNTGRIPQFRIFRETVNGEYSTAPSGLYAAARGGYRNFWVDTTNVYYIYNAYNGTIPDIGTVFVRFYHDV